MKLNFRQLNSRAPNTLLCLLALAPACFIAIAIYLYAVDLPIGDEWAQAAFFPKLAQGTLTVRDLFAQQQEYRQFFPNLVVVGLGWLTKWDVRYEMALNFLLACLISYNIYRLSELLPRMSRDARLLLFFAANLLLFSPIQFENWLNGQQLIYFMPAVCLTTSLRLAFGGRTRPWLRLLGCAALCFVSTFSAANGFLCWLIVALALCLRAPAWDALRHRRIWLCVWLAGLAVCLALYLHGYHSPWTTGGPLSFAHSHPLDVVLHFLCVLGGPLGLRQFIPALAAGALLLALFVYVWRRYTRLAMDADSRQPLLCWLLLATYAVMTAVLINIARAHFGVAQALSLRYTSYTLYLPLALVYLLTLDDGGVATRLANGLTQRTVLIASLVLVLHIPIYLLGLRYMSASRVTVLHAKACLLPVNVVQDECQTPVFHDNAYVRARANELDRLGYLRPPLLKSARMSDLSAADAQTPSSYGSFDNLTPAGDEYGANGLALLPYRNEPADAVLLAWERPGQDATAFAIADVEVERDLLSALLRHGIYRDARWHKTFSARALPPGATTITAWAFDATTGKAYRLAGVHTIGQTSSKFNVQGSTLLEP